jgi:outer membrane protein
MLAPCAAWAQGTLQLSLARAVEIAQTEEGSARVALAMESIRRAESQVAQAKAAFFPDINASLQERNQTVNLRTFGFNFDFPGFQQPTVVGPFTVADLRASAQQPVLNFSTIRRYRASRSGLAASRAELEATRDDVADQVARAYLAGLRADAALASAQSNVELAQALLGMAESQRNAGTGTGIEVTRAQVQLANDRQRLEVAENERRRAVLQLLRAMGLDLAVNVELTDSLRYEAVDTAALEQMLATAREMRAELKAQKQREETARLNLDAAEAERLPTLSAFGDYGGIGQPRLGLERTRTVGLSVSIPVFDGGRRKARVADSLSQYRAEQIRSRDLADQVELEVRLAIDSLRSAELQVRVAEEGLKLAQNEVEQAQRRYQAGVAVPLEVTDAQARLSRARDNQIAALYSYNLARLELASAEGTIEEFVRR